MAHHDPLTQLANRARLMSFLEHALEQPVDTGLGPIEVHASVGLVTARPGDTADEVIKNADIAMYTIKRSRRVAPSQTILMSEGPQ